MDAYYYTEKVALRDYVQNPGVKKLANFDGFRGKGAIFARDSICCSAHYAVARPSVCPSVRHTGGSVKNA